MLTYTELNNKSYEELLKIRDEILEKIFEAEKERQSLISNILFFQNCKDLYSASNGVFKIENSYNSKH